MDLLSLPLIAVSGDYRLAAASPRALRVGDGVSARLFCDGADALGAWSVALGAGASCDFFATAFAPGEFRLATLQESRESRVRVRLALAAKGGGALRASVLATVGGDGNRADVKIVSLVADASRVELDGSASVLEGARRAEAYVAQENVFLDATGTVRGVPGLLVKSQDVKSGHSARVHRLSDERLFYLRSRGVSKDRARAMMLRDALHGLFGELDAASREARTLDALGFVLGEGARVDFAGAAL